jgi:xanthine/CO dehydrogenase XdhC/CoxF family maturation factor
VDHRPAALSSGRFPTGVRLDARRSEAGIAGLPLGPRAFAVVKMHSFAHDREWARRLFESGVPYVGLLGPRERGRKILEQIGAEAGERVFAPVGLDLGAEGPEQVAIAIVGELLAVHASKQPWSLREKEGHPCRLIRSFGGFREGRCSASESAPPCWCPPPGFSAGRRAIRTPP